MNEPGSATMRNVRARLTSMTRQHPTETCERSAERHQIYLSKISIGVTGRIRLWAVLILNIVGPTGDESATCVHLTSASTPEPLNTRTTIMKAPAKKPAAKAAAKKAPAKAAAKPAAKAAAKKAPAKKK